MSFTLDIVGVLRKAGIPMNVDQIAEQLPHIPRGNVASACSQYKRAGKFISQVEDQRVTYAIAPGMDTETLGDTPVEIDECAGKEAEEIDAAPAEGSEPKPPTQSFSPAGLDVHAAAPSTVARPMQVPPVTVTAETNNVGGRFSATLGGVEAAVRVFDRGREREVAFDPKHLAADLSGGLRAIANSRNTANRDNRLARELAAAVLARWPGEIPYDVQRLVNSAAALPL